MNWVDGLVSALRATGSGELASRLLADFPVGTLTTYRVGGTAAAYVIVEDPSELVAIGAAAVSIGCSTMVIGRGSNLLVADAGVDALVVQLGDGFGDVEFRDDESSPGLFDGVGSEVSLRAGGAALLPVVARMSVAAGWTGFEWAVGVPGSMGGAVRMNAGGHGSDMAASVVRVRAVDLNGGEDETMTAAQLGFGYRHSSLRSTQVVYSVELALSRRDAASRPIDLAEIVRWRREHQPGGQNAGSVFRNPPNGSAGALIEAAGCKGLRVRSAEVSTKHANFIQADSDGSADDVLALMNLVRRRVAEATGIELVAETHVVGAAADVCGAAGVPDAGRAEP